MWLIGIGVAALIIFVVLKKKQAQKKQESIVEAASNFLAYSFRTLRPLDSSVLAGNYIRDVGRTQWYKIWNRPLLQLARLNLTTI